MLDAQADWGYETKMGRCRQKSSGEAVVFRMRCDASRPSVLNSLMPVPFGILHRGVINTLRRCAISIPILDLRSPKCSTRRRSPLFLQRCRCCNLGRP